MNKIWMWCALAAFAGVAGPIPAADPGAGAGAWHGMLDHGAAGWRGWKEPGFPAGWHVAGGDVTLRPWLIRDVSSSKIS